MADKEIKDFTAVTSPASTDVLVTQQSGDDVTRKITVEQIAGAGTPNTHATRHISGGADAFTTAQLLEAVIKRIKESGGQDLLVGAIADTELIKRSGTGLIGVAAPEILNRDVVVAEVVNTVTETTVYSFSVPANTLGTDRMLRLTMIADVLQNGSVGGSSIEFKVKFGATTIGTVKPGDWSQQATRFGIRMVTKLSALNATGAQVADTAFLTSESGVTGTSVSRREDRHSFHNTVAEDTTGALTLSVTAKWDDAHASNSFIARVFQLELI